MPNQITPFGSIELAVRALILEHFEPLQALDPAERAGRVGGDLDFDVDDDEIYIRIDKVGGSSDRFEGTFAVDIEVFGSDYLATESHALDLEALLLGYPHVVEVGGRKVVFDEVSQNTLPDDLPWEDDRVTRLGATYVITARRR